MIGFQKSSGTITYLSSVILINFVPDFGMKHKSGSRRCVCNWQITASVIIFGAALIAFGLSLLLCIPIVQFTKHPTPAT